MSKYKICWIIGGIAWTSGVFTFALDSGPSPWLGASFWGLLAIFSFSLGVVLRPRVVEVDMREDLVTVMFTKAQYQTLVAALSPQQLSDPPSSYELAIEVLLSQHNEES